VAVSDEVCPFDDDQSFAADITLDFGSVFQFDEVGGGEVALDIALNDDISCFDFGLDVGPGGDIECSLGDDLSLEGTEDLDPLFKSELPFEFGIRANNGLCVAFVHGTGLPVGSLRCLIITGVIHDFPDPSIRFTFGLIMVGMTTQASISIIFFQEFFGGIDEFVHAEWFVEIDIDTQGVCIDFVA